MNEELYLKIEEYFLQSFDIDRLFTTIKRSDFLFLHHINICMEKSECEDGAYLSELAEEMKLSIPAVSNAARRLQEHGYIEWEMAPGRDRTYVKLTGAAIELMHAEREKMRKTYEIINSEISEEDLHTTITTIKKINEFVKKLETANKKDDAVE